VKSGIGIHAGGEPRYKGEGLEYLGFKKED